MDDKHKSSPPIASPGVSPVQFVSTELLCDTRYQAENWVIVFAGTRRHSHTGVPWMNRKKSFQPITPIARMEIGAIWSIFHTVRCKSGRSCSTLPFPSSAPAVEHGRVENADRKGKLYVLPCGLWKCMLAVVWSMGFALMKIVHDDS